MKIRPLLLGLLGVHLMPLAVLDCRAANVDTELVILVDAQTYSASDFNLIIENVAQSFERQDFIDSVMNGIYGKMATSVMLYNLSGQQVATSWAELSTPQQFANFAQTVRGIAYPNRGGNVSYAAAITAATNSINSSSFVGTTKQITLIDDATGFYSADPAGTLAARNSALAAGVDLINAIVFDAAHRETEIANFYNTNVVNQPGGVTLISSPQGGPKSSLNLSQISTSISSQISEPTMTISAVPEPSGLLLMGASALVFCAGLRRRG